MGNYKIPLPSQKELHLIGRYVSGLYRQNYFVVAAYVAGNTFESIINVFLQEQDKLDFMCGTQECLHKKIEALNTSSILKAFHISVTNQEMLDIKNIRNEIVHGFIRDIEKSKIKSLVEFIWNVTKKEKEPILDEIDLKTAQYWVRDFEVAIEKDAKIVSYYNSAKEITKEDFLDLYEMRHRFLEIEDYIDKPKRLEAFAKYKVDNVSAVNPTSAYVWLAIVEAESKSRKKIYGSSISILATPLDFRIYLDFGGLAFNDRKRYYKFLQSFDPSALDIETENLNIFDIDWYAFFGERHYFLDYAGTLAFKEKAKESVDLVTKSKKNIPLPWNKLLIGYVYEREELSDGKLSFDEIWIKLKNIIKLYEYFQMQIEELEKPRPKNIYTENDLVLAKYNKKRK